MRRYLPLVVTMVFWGSAFAASKSAVADVPHHVAALLRFGAGAVILSVVLVLRSGKGTPVRGRDLPAVAVLGMLGVFTYNLLFFWGLSLAPAIDGSVIVPVMSPVLTTAAMVLLGRERLTGPRLAGLVTAVAGASVFFAATVRSAGSLGGSRTVGDGIFFLAAASWAAYTIRGRPVLSRLEPLRVTAYATAAGAGLLALVAVPSLSTVAWSGLSVGFWLNVAYLAVFPTAVAYVLYYRGVRAVGPTRAATVMFVVPVVGIVCSSLFLGESITPGQAVGSVGMVAGAWLAIIGLPRRAAKAPEPAAPADPPHRRLISGTA